MEENFDPGGRFFDRGEEPGMAGLDQAAIRVRRKEQPVLPGQVIGFIDHLHGIPEFRQGAGPEGGFEFQESVQEPFHNPGTLGEVEVKTQIPAEPGIDFQNPRARTVQDHELPFAAGGLDALAETCEPPGGEGIGPAIIFFPLFDILSVEGVANHVEIESALLGHPPPDSPFVGKSPGIVLLAHVRAVRIPAPRGAPQERGPLGNQAGVDPKPVQEVFLRFGDLTDEIAEPWFPFRQGQVAAQAGVGRNMDSGLRRAAQVEGNPVRFPVIQRCETAVP
jgi:hypothetical protein